MDFDQVAAKFGALWNEGYAPFLDIVDRVRQVIEAVEARPPLTQNDIDTVDAAVDFLVAQRAIFNALMDDYRAAFKQAEGRALRENDTATLRDLAGLAVTMDRWQARLDTEFDKLGTANRALVRMAHAQPPGTAERIMRAVEAIADATARNAPWIVPAGALAALGAVALGLLWWFRVPRRPSRR